MALAVTSPAVSDRNDLRNLLVKSPAVIDLNNLRDLRNLLVSGLAVNDLRNQLVRGLAVNDLSDLISLGSLLLVSGLEVSTLLLL